MSSILSNEKMFHLKIKPGDVGKYVILTGDPARVPKIAALLKDGKLLSQNREYTIYNGYLNKTLVTVASTGIGGPSAAICVEELIKCGADTFIRVGTSGGMKLDVVGGDLCIATAAVKDEGTSAEYLPISYPAAADFEIVNALINSAKKLSDKCEGNSYHVGVVQSKDSFYGETNPETMAVEKALKQRWEAELKLGCLCSEMECAAIFSVALTRNVRAGAVLLAIWNVERTAHGLANPLCEDSTRAIKCALGAIEELIKMNN
ncbi:MAG: nucleoside phosphorylase [Firmicutes bacterium]|nr:nucleoside phosphorylase [Bacillota bacterium]